MLDTHNRCHQSLESTLIATEDTHGLILVSDRVLTGLISSSLQQVTVAGEGGLRALVALSRCDDLELRILAAGALRHLSLNTRVKRPMVEEGALGSIIRLATRHFMYNFAGVILGGHVVGFVKTWMAALILCMYRYIERE